jgi:hypothetical protein
MLQCAQEFLVACPFFYPTERMTESPWAHPARLPLGDSWAGRCTVPGHEQDTLGSDELRHCNVGYAGKYCSRLPAQRACDAVRFNARDAGQISVFFIREINYLPVDLGTLEFDRATRRCLNPHPDACLQRLAEAFLDSWLASHPLRA